LMLPLAATESRLRRSLLPGLYRRVEYNFARGARSIRLFELGTVFSATDEPLPAESTRLAVVLSGLREPPHWSTADVPFDVWDLRGLLDELATTLGFTVAAGAPPDEAVLDSAFAFTLHDSAGRGVGRAGRVRDGVVDAPAWADDVWGVEIELDAAAAAARHRRYTPVPQHPAVERDLAL